MSGRPGGPVQPTEDYGEGECLIHELMLQVALQIPVVHIQSRFKAVTGNTALYMCAPSPEQTVIHNAASGDIGAAWFRHQANTLCTTCAGRHRPHAGRHVSAFTSITPVIATSTSIRQPARTTVRQLPTHMQQLGGCASVHSAYLPKPLPIDSSYSPSALLLESCRATSQSIWHLEPR
jgi:hypothetical protein